MEIGLHRGMVANEYKAVGRNSYENLKTPILTTSPEHLNNLDLIILAC